MREREREGRGEGVEILDWRLQYFIFVHHKIQNLFEKQDVIIVPLVNSFHFITSDVILR